jgi:hypothetical protein
MSPTRDSGLVKIGAGYRMPSTKTTSSAPPGADSSSPTREDGAQVSKGGAGSLHVGASAST